MWGFDLSEHHQHRTVLSQPGRLPWLDPPRPEEQLSQHSDQAGEPEHEGTLLVWKWLELLHQGTFWFKKFDFLQVRLERSHRFKKFYILYNYIIRFTHAVKMFWLLENTFSPAWKDQLDTFCSLKPARSEKIQRRSSLGSRNGGRFYLKTFLSDALRATDVCPEKCECHIGRNPKYSYPFKV